MVLKIFPQAVGYGISDAILMIFIVAYLTSFFLDSDIEKTAFHESR